MTTDMPPGSLQRPRRDPNGRTTSGSVSPAFLAYGAAIQYDGRHPTVATLDTSELTIVQDAQIRRLTNGLATANTTVADNHTLLVTMQAQLKSLQTSMRITGILTAGLAFAAITVALAAHNAR